MRYYMFNKPRGCITACRDERHKTVMDYFSECDSKGLFPVGRLDKDTEGFLIVTDDGEFCNKVNSPKSEVSKTYRFWARGSLTQEKLMELERGVFISAIPDRPTAPAKVKRLGEATLLDIAHLLDEDEKRLRLTKRGSIPITHVEIEITEGKKHQVKKMAQAVGMYVVYLERIAISSVRLDSELPRGKYRPLSEDEINQIKNSK